jgi:hypothetical protein
VGGLDGLPPQLFNRDASKVPFHLKHFVFKLRYFGCPSLGHVLHVHGQLFGQLRHPKAVAVAAAELPSN